MNTTEKLNNLMNDEDFARQLATLNTPEELRDLLNSYGITVTMDELMALTVPASSTVDGELSDIDLDNVAGGGKILDWIIRWIKRRGEKEEKKIEDILAGLY